MGQPCDNQILINQYGKHGIQVRDPGMETSYPNVIIYVLVYNNFTMTDCSDIVQIFAHECDECDFKTDSQAYLKNHIRYRHTNEGIIYRCDLCPQTFTFPWAVVKHKEDQHTIGDLRKCSFCDYISVSKNVQRHENKHKYPDEKVECTFCGKMIMKINLGVHKAKHYHKKNKNIDSDLLVYHCKKCNYKTDKLKHLNVHMVNKHPISVLNCNYCKFTSPFETKLDLHIAKQAL